MRAGSADPDGAGGERQYGFSLLKKRKKSKRKPLQRHRRRQLAGRGPAAERWSLCAGARRRGPGAKRNVRSADADRNRNSTYRAKALAGIKNKRREFLFPAVSALPPDITLTATENPCKALFLPPIKKNQEEQAASCRRRRRQLAGRGPAAERWSLCAGARRRGSGAKRNVRSANADCNRNSTFRAKALAPVKISNAHFDRRVSALPPDITLTATENPCKILPPCRSHNNLGVRRFISAFQSRPAFTGTAVQLA